MARTVSAADLITALRALLGGPDASERALGDTTSIPAGSQVLDAQVTGSTATVRLDAAFAAAAAPPALRAREAQVVFTATQFPGIDRVVIAAGGTPTTAALTRLDLTDVLDTVLTDTPAAGEVVTSPMPVSGMSDTFEAHVRLRLRDAAGHVLADTATDATSGNGVWGTFATRLTFSTPATATGTLEVFDASQGDSAGAHGQTIPVRFRATLSGND